MAVKVLALESAVTTLQDHRELNGGLAQAAGNISVRSGIFPGGTSAASLSTVSAMVARVGSFKAIINNGVSAALGPYMFVSDSTVDITFDAGEAAVPRVDRIIARVYDDVNDGSGDTKGEVEYLKGQASGSATALPTNSILLYEMTIPAGASSGGGGVNFANAVDQRDYTVASGGIMPVKSNTIMSAISAPFEGMTIYRTDLDVLYSYDGSTWRPRGVATVASSANLTDINNPYDGAVAVTRDTDAVYVYSGSTWAQPKAFFKPIGRMVATGNQTLADNTQVAIQFSAADDIDTHGQHNPASNNTRVTPNVPGYYRFYGVGFFNEQASPNVLDVNFRLNGSTNLAGGTRHPGNASHAMGLVAQVTVLMNGTTDYIEFYMRQDSGGSDTTHQSSQFSSVVEWEYLGPSSY